MTDYEKAWRESAKYAHKLEIVNAALLEALKALVEGRPTHEPDIGDFPKEKSIAYRNWTLFEKARKAIREAPPISTPVETPVFTETPESTKESE